MRSLQSFGGEARGRIQKQEALDKYNSSPKICRECSTIIKPSLNQKISEVKTKDFCNRSCAARFNNSRRVRKIITFKTCGIRINVLGMSALSIKVLFDFGSYTKGELFKKYRNWQSARSSIRRHAARVWKDAGRKLECSVCGYNLHAEVAHIKPVSDFSDESSIKEINAVENLKALCPNHHWEFDNLLRGALVSS